MFRLESLRDISGYSVKDVCEVLSCCRAQLYNLEHGRYNPDNVSYCFVRFLSDLYEVPMEYIYKIMRDDFTEVSNHVTKVSEDPDQYKLYD